MQVEYNILKPNSFDSKEFYNFLEKVDRDFNPPLSDRVDLGSFAKKVCANATLFIASHAGKIIGYNAVYVNDRPKEAYATSLAVLPDYQTVGLIGVKLVKMAIEYARKRSACYQLCINGANVSMLHFYLREGFEIEGEDFFPNSTIKRVHLILKF